MGGEDTGRVVRGRVSAGPVDALYRRPHNLFAGAIVMGHDLQTTEEETPVMIPHFSPS